MPGLYCENCGFAEHESDCNIGPVREYRSPVLDGPDLIETLCEFCASVEIAAGIPHELVKKEDA